MTPPMNHSPLPWRVDWDTIRDADGSLVNEEYQHTFKPYNVGLIVHAVNNIERVEADLSRVKEVNEKLDSGCKECANMIQALLPHSICAEEIRQRLISAIRDNAKLKEESAKMKGEL